jgi:hypothetical protein
MNNRRRKSSKNQKVVAKGKIIRCKSRMVPVFGNDTCEGFLKKDNTESNNVCRNCRHSF